jgi:hypothetical protein
MSRQAEYRLGWIGTQRRLFDPIGRYESRNVHTKTRFGHKHPVSTQLGDTSHETSTPTPDSDTRVSKFSRIRTTQLGLVSKFSRIRTTQLGLFCQLCRICLNPYTSFLL